jgi:hypothetical protein
MNTKVPKKTPIYTLCLLLTIALSSCERDPDDIRTQLSGKLLVANSELFLPHAKVDLVYVTGGLYTSFDRILDSTRTDSLGNYSFDFNIDFDKRYGTYQLVSSYPNYYSTRDITGPFPTDGKHFELGGKQTYNPQLHPFAWLKVKLNISSNAYAFSMNRTFGEFEGVIINNPRQQEFVVKTKGNANNVLSFFIDTPDSLITIIDTIYCGNNDTALKIINY